MNDVDQALLDYQFGKQQATPGKKQSGFEPDPVFKEPCFHQSHRPPTGMVIPRGQRYRHVCPGCGAEIIIRSHNVTC